MQRFKQPSHGSPRTERSAGRFAGLARRHGSRRRGIASVLAMLYMIIFSTLAVGFYAAVTMASQLAHNDEKALNAQVVTESGLRFVQYQLGRVRVPGNTPPNEMMQKIHEDLLAQQAGSPNFAGRSITLSGSTIHFPANDFIPLDERGAGFRAEISDAGDGLISVKIHGRYRGTTISRMIQMHFESVISSLNVFDFGIVTRGPINVSGGGVIGGGGVAADGSILSLSKNPYPISLSGTSGIAGNVYMTNKTGNVNISGGGVTIAGKKAPELYNHIIKGVEEPELPESDSRIFLPYAVNTYKPGQKVYTNVIIPPNTNPSFTGDTEIHGVLYIQYPNKVTFNSHTIIRGTIVVENGATPSTKNLITFGGGVEAYAVTTVPTDTIPEDSPLRKLVGSTLLAPGFHVSLGGQSGSIGGIMMAHSYEFTGGSGGVIEGTFIGLGDVEMKFTGGASIARSKPSGPIPVGLVFPRTFRPLRETYLEIRPPVALGEPALPHGATAGKSPDEGDRGNSRGNSKRGSERVSRNMSWL